INGIQGPPKFISPMYQGHLRSNIGQKNAPVQGRIPAPGNQHLLVPIDFGIPDKIGNSPVLKGIDMGYQRLPGLKTTESPGNGHYRCVMLCALVGSNHKGSIRSLFNGIGPLPQGKTRLKGLYLLHQVIYQVTCQDFGKSRDIINGLLWVNFRALPAHLWQGIYKMAL